MAGENKSMVGNMNMDSLLALSLPFLQILLSVFVGAFLARKQLAKTDRFLVMWLIYNGTTHLLLEGAFVFLTFTETVQASKYGKLAFVWKEYANADKRFGGFDSGVASIELITATLGTLLVFILMDAILNKRWYRHFVQIVLCTMELYGGYMTFAPELFTGNKNLNTSNPLYLWVYLVFFNGLWVVIPLYMLWNSWTAMAPPTSRRSTSSPKKAAQTPARYNLRSRKDD